MNDQSTPRRPVVPAPRKSGRNWSTWVLVLIALGALALGALGTLGVQSVHQAVLDKSTLSAEQLEIEDELAELERRGFAAPVLQDELANGKRVYSTKVVENCFALITMMGGNQGPTFGNIEDANRDKVQRIQCASSAGGQPAAGR